jgi:hypothetical protein
MPDSLALPIRVLVKGASTVGWSSTKRGARSDFTFPRAIQAELHRLGRPADVQSITIPSERTKTTLRNWEREIIGWSPDVVILVYGHYETIHLILPWWLERHANSLRARPGRFRRLYRTRVLRPTWMALARLQARLDTMIDPNIRRSRPRRVAADLEKLIKHIETISSPLIYLFELQPPASRSRSWFPGMTARMQVMNDAIRSLVDRLDNPNVRYFTTSDLIKEHAGGDLDVATPDGFHYTPHMHRIIGEELAHQIADWADTQEHLKPVD